MAEECAMKERKLFDSGMGHTQRLKDILDKKIHPNIRDIMELWNEFNESSKSWAGVQADPVDFGEWISGTGNWADAGACVVTW